MWGTGEVHAGFWWGKDHLEDRRVWEDNIKKDLQEVGWVGMDWIDQTEYRDRWRALVNAVMNLRVS